MRIHIRIFAESNNIAESYITIGDTYMRTVYSVLMMLNTINSTSDRAEVGRVVCEMIDQIIDAGDIVDAYLDWTVHGYADEYDIHVNRV